MRKLQLLIIGLRAYIGLVRNPHKLDNAISLANYTQGSPLLQKARDRIATDPGGRRALQERWWLDKSEYEKLQKLEPGTLGYEYQRHLRERNLDPYAFPPVKHGTDTQYMLARTYQTHDLYHLVTGFDTEVAGEMGLQAFYAAQTGGPFTMIALSALLLNCVLFDFSDLDNRMNAIADGWRMGKRAKMFFGVHWETIWDVPLQKVREDLGIIAAQGRAADFAQGTGLAPYEPAWNGEPVRL